jgi:sigma-B regulation protein RsbU (phosphoserine phosphatase)
MTAAPRTEHPKFQDWNQLASLGEQLRNEESLSAQRDRIIAMTSRLISGKVDVWLNEIFFRLPDWEDGQVFPAQPPKGGMRLAIKAGKITTQKLKRKTKTASSVTFVSIPLEDQGITLGALQITRPKGPEFTDEELNLLQGLAQIVSVSLFAAHRAEVEQFRLRQLNLVREVSAQIANVLDVNDLSKRVAKLIQKTFNFYYVAIFTLDPHDHALHFRASAVASRKGKKKASIALEVEIGQGLIGEAAKTGTEIVCDDVQADAALSFHRQPA